MSHDCPSLKIFGSKEKQIEKKKDREGPCWNAHMAVGSEWGYCTFLFRPTFCCEVELRERKEGTRESKGAQKPHFYMPF